MHLKQHQAVENLSTSINKNVKKIRNQMRKRKTILEIWKTTTFCQVTPSLIFTSSSKNLLPIERFTGWLFLATELSSTFATTENTNETFQTFLKNKNHLNTYWHNELVWIFVQVNRSSETWLINETYSVTKSSKSKFPKKISTNNWQDQIQRLLWWSSS